MPVLASIFVYPVKSLGGVSLVEAEVTPAGLRHDRRWMAVDPAGTFLTRREVPAMARITVNRDGDRWRLAAEGRGSVRLPLEADGVDTMPVTVWRDRVTALPGPGEADEWLSEALDRPCRLVFVPDGHLRPVDPNHGRPGDVVSFADGYPALLVAAASVDAVDARVGVPISARRFRPNLVVEGTEAFEEDGWRIVEIGAAVFENVKPCARCVVVDQDPDTGERSGEVLRELAAFRRRGAKAIFGVNLVPRGAGRVRVGDPVRGSS